MCCTDVKFDKIDKLKINILTDLGKAPNRVM